MGQIHKIGDEYYIEFTARGLIYQQKAGSDVVKAQELLAAIEEKIANGELQTIVRDVDLDVFFVNFLKSAIQQYHSLTIKRLKSAIIHFENYIRLHYGGVNKISQITPRIMEEYKLYAMNGCSNNRPYNPKIINLTLLLLRDVFEYGLKDGLINNNPVLYVVLLTMPSNQRPELTDEQWQRIFNKSEIPYQTAFTLMRFSGLKAAESIDLKWKNVDFNRNVLFVRNREIPILPEVFDQLKKLESRVIDFKEKVCGEEISLTRLNEVFNAAVGADRVSMSVLRQYFIERLLRKGLSVLKIVKWTGVDDVAKIMKYSSKIPLTREEFK